ncbi:MAG TPA: hypothetical protein VF765_00740 [Polyangiaceae bacterium]
MRAFVASVAALVSCGGTVGSSPAPGTCSGPTLVASTPVTLASESPVPPNFPASVAVQALATPWGLLVITGGGNSDAPQPIQAWRVAVAADGTTSVSSATIADAGKKTYVLGVAGAPGTADAAVLWDIEASGGGSVTSFVTTVRGDGGTLRVMPAVTLNAPFESQSSVAFDGSEFAVFTADIASTPRLEMQRVSLDGTVKGGPLTVIGPPEFNGGARALSTPEGAALVWSDSTPSDPYYSRSHVSLIRADGSIAHDAILQGVLRWTGKRLLDVVPSQTGAPTTQVVDLGWFGGPSWTTTLPGYGGADTAVAEANGQILIATSDSLGSTTTVYGAAPGKPFVALGKASSPAAFGADGCGHWVLASAPPQNTGVQYEHGGSWTLSKLGATAEHLSVGSDLPYMYMGGGSFVQTPGGLGFVWNENSQGSDAPSTVRFATLRWQP